MHSFGGMSWVSHIAWQSSKAVLFNFIQNSVFRIQFNISAQRLSFWHQLLLVIISQSLQNCVLDCTYPSSLKSYIALTFPLFRFGTVFQSYLKCCLLGCSPHFAPNKTQLTSLKLCIFKNFPIDLRERLTEKRRKKSKKVIWLMRAEVDAFFGKPSWLLVIGFHFLTLRYFRLRCLFAYT